MQFNFYCTECVRVTFFNFKTYIKKLWTIQNVRFPRSNRYHFKKISFNILINKYRVIDNAKCLHLEKHDKT